MVDGDGSGDSVDGDGSGGSVGSDSGASPASCTETGCDGTAAVRLHVPWDANREVCAACARSIVQQDGVVAEPLDGATTEWP